MRERFEVRSITGYSAGYPQNPATSYWVLDHDYAQVVAKYYSGGGGRDQGARERLAKAEARCRALNEQERRWLHSGRWS